MGICSVKVADDQLLPFKAAVRKHLERQPIARGKSAKNGREYVITVEGCQVIFFPHSATSAWREEELLQQPETLFAFDLGDYEYHIVVQSLTPNR